MSFIFFIDDENDNIETYFTEATKMTRLIEEKIKQRTFIAAAPEKVYDTITSAKEWDSFFTTGMILEPRAGGKCEFAWKDWGPDFYSFRAPPGKIILCI